MPLRWVAFAVLVVVLAGCNGGTVDRHALTNDAATIDSLACEGALLAHEVARGKATSHYVSGQAGALRAQSSNLADALATRPALAPIEKRVRAKARVSSRLAALLGKLHDHPSDRGVAATVELQLRKLGGCK